MESALSPQHCLENFSLLQDFSQFEQSFLISSESDGIRAVHGCNANRILFERREGAQILNNSKRYDQLVRYFFFSKS